MRISNKLGDKIQQQASTRYVLMAGTLAIDFRATRQICCGGCSATSTTNFVEQGSCSCALAILEAALKQMHMMHVCALLHKDVTHLSHHLPACFFCWPHQPELPAAFLLLAACVLVLVLVALVVPAAGWCLLAVLVRTGACALGPTCVDLGLAHRNAL
jgi:hypothetical protein